MLPPSFSLQWAVRLLVFKSAGQTVWGQQASDLTLISDFTTPQFTALRCFAAGEKRRRAGSPERVADSATILKPAPVESPSDAEVSFISDPYVAFLAAPVFLVAPLGLSASFRPLMGAVNGDLRRLMSEREFYALATSIRPPFTEAVGDAAGKFSARALFSVAALQTQAWLLPGDCEPELHLLALLSAGATGLARWPPGFNGELKTAGNRRSIEQSVVYTLMDVVRIFFPATADAPYPPRFFALPPVGYALVGYPHVAYLLALEWVGKLIVSPISQPFLLGSPEHKAAVLGLASPAYAEPVVLPEGLEWFSGSCPSTHAAHSVVWSVTGGMFRKRVRATAHTAEVFGSMHCVYAALERLLPACPLASLPRSTQLLYGAHEVLVEMEFIAGEPCVDADVLQRGPIQDCVAQAVAWLARHHIVYTDIRGSNVIKRQGAFAAPPGGAAASSGGRAAAASPADAIAAAAAAAIAFEGPAQAAAPVSACATLVDFDDAMLMPSAILSLEEYDAVIEHSRDADRDVCDRLFFRKICELSSGPRSGLRGGCQCCSLRVRALASAGGGGASDRRRRRDTHTRTRTQTEST